MSVQIAARRKDAPELILLQPGQLDAIEAIVGRAFKG
jgi:hypothetical protein